MIERTTNESVEAPVLAAMAAAITAINCKSSVLLSTTVVAAGVGILLYVISFVLSIKVLKTEVKAQKKAFEILVKEGLATHEEVDMMQELFKLYNIQYVIDLILEFLQMIMKVLEVVAKMQNSSNSSASND